MNDMTSTVAAICGWLLVTGWACAAAWLYGVWWASRKDAAYKARLKANQKTLAKNWGKSAKRRGRRG